MPFDDPNTLSNHNSIRTVHTHLDVALDFEGHKVAGWVTYKAEAAEDGVKELVLDTSFLDVRKVEVDGKGVQFKVEERTEPYGSALKIELGKEVKKGEEVEVKVCNCGFRAERMQSDMELEMVNESADLERERSSTAPQTSAQHCSG